MNQKTGYNFNSVDLLIYIWNKRFILLLVGLLAGVASIVVSLLITPMYEANVIMFPATNTNVSKELLVSHWSGENVHGFGEEDQAEQLLQVLHSEPIRTRIMRKYNLMEHYEIDPEGKYPMTEFIEQYRSNIKFRLTEFMSVEISVMDKDPELAAKIANDISDLVDTIYNSMKKKRALAALQLVEKEYSKVKTSFVRMKDTLNQLSSELSEDMEKLEGDDFESNLARVVAEKGPQLLIRINQVRTEVGLEAGYRQRYMEAKLEAEQSLSHKFVVEKAIPPEKKAYPNKSLIVIVSTFSALLLALIVLIVIDNIKRRVSDLNVE